MGFVEDLKVWIFFGFLGAVFIGALGRRLFGWGLRPEQVAADRQKGPTAPQQQARPPVQQQYQQSGQAQRISPQAAQQQQYYQQQRRPPGT